MRIEVSCPPHLADLLPPPVPARRTLPDWLNAMPLTQDVENFGVERTVKNCPPFLDAMCQGFVLPLATDITVEGGRFSWDWPASESPLSFHFPSQLPGTPFVRDGEVVIKFNNHWTIKTEPGWSMMFTHPVNRDDLPFRTLSGLVDTDAFNQLPVNFPALWVDRAFTGVLPAGTPVVQCIPIRLEDEEIVVRTLGDTAVRDRDRLKQDVRRQRDFYRDDLRRPRPAINVVTSRDDPARSPDGSRDPTG